MKIMKKILLSSATIGLLAIPLVGLAAAAANNAPNLDVMVVLQSVINWLFAILLVIAALCIIIAAYFFVTAAGNPEQTAKARTFVLYAIVGLIVAFLAKGIVALVGTIVT